METDAPPIPKELQQEVRVAIALNGGISLAIWMGGCAVELDAARRAHRGVETLTPLPPSKHATTAKSFLTGSPPAPRLAGDPPAVAQRTMYNAICRAFGRELVIDLMSGASAGGINGALLSCAIAHERRLQPNFLRTKWLQLGDLSTLLQRTSNPGPRSLMRGRMFHRELERTFGALTLSPSDSKKAAELELTAEDFALTALPSDQSPLEQPLIPSLDVTTTNLVGIERTFADAWNGSLVAREYRGRFQFRLKDDYNAKNLATAARSSASFPFAFEPWAVEEQPARLAGLSTGSFLIDGGLLDNAPIKAVLDLIPDRAASRQVARYVCYLNADPPLSEAEELAKAAKGRSRGEDERPVQAPSLSKLAGKCIGLPGKARFVDQLDVIERRARLARFARDSEPGLLGASTEALEELATQLLPAYRTRRTLLSLEELFESEQSIRDVLRDGPTPPLPWVPTRVADRSQVVWGWGLRAAQRVIHLLLDAIRAAVKDAQKDDRTDRLLSLLDARTAIDHQLSVIHEERAVLLPNSRISALVKKLAEPSLPGEDPVAKLQAVWSDPDATAGRAVRAAARTAVGLKDDLRVVHREGARARDLDYDLFGPRTGDDDARAEAFITRALHIEVIRRSHGDERDIDSAQVVRFVQLTPCTKVPIFTKWVKKPPPGTDEETPSAPDGIDEETPATPEDKLAGIRLGHFASFYRSAWRANDFMWGRLDASTRIVELLVDPARAAQLHRQDAAINPWQTLACCLLPRGCHLDDDRAWLVREELQDWMGNSIDDLREHLTVSLQQDLIDVGNAGQATPDGTLTRRLCARAVQLEILQDELTILDEASKQDRLAGASSKPLALPLDTGRLREAILRLRPDKAGQKRTLPELLDARGRTELGSTLGLRTVTHIAFVTLAALRHAKVPFAKALYILRALLFPVMGAASRVGWYRVVVVVGFWAATLYLTSRVLAMPSDAPQATLGEAVSRPVLVSYAALLAVIGVASMPALRAWIGGSLLRRIAQTLWAVGLFVAGVGLVVGLALTAGDMSPARLLVSAGSLAVPPELLEKALFGVIFGLPVFRLVPGVRGKIADWFDASHWTGPVFAGAFAVLTVWLVAWAIFLHVGEFLDGGPWWKRVGAWNAVAGAPALAAIYLALAHIRDKASGSFGGGDAQTP